MADQEQHIEYITQRAIDLGCTYALAKYTQDLEIQIGMLERQIERLDYVIEDKCTDLMDRVNEL